MSEPRKTFQELLEKQNVPPESLGDMTVMRPVYEEFMLQTPVPSDVSIVEAELGGVLALEVSAPEATADAAILFFHGGVFAMGSPRASANLAGLLSREARAKVFSVEYRLAPENPYPAAPEDALRSYRGLLEDGIGQERIALFGESAGGGLALGTMVAARDAGLPQPAAGLLYSPWVDLTLSGASMDTKASVDYLLARDALQGAVYGYAGGADPSSAQVSPLFEDLRGIAPLHIQCGSYEVLLDDATRLAATAAAADVAVQLDVTPEMPHVFQASAPELVEANAALERTGAFLRSRFDPAG
ncbi:MAG: alpha/beta hydrolase [Solirubrobacterales bacterium]